MRNGSSASMLQLRFNDGFWHVGFSSWVEVLSTFFFATDDPLRLTPICRTYCTSRPERGFRRLKTLHPSHCHSLKMVRARTPTTRPIHEASYCMRMTLDCQADFKLCTSTRFLTSLHRARSRFWSRVLCGPAENDESDLRNTEWDGIRFDCCAPV